jgi:hypothetical protein
MSFIILGPLKRYIGELLRTYLSTYIKGIEVDEIGFLGSEIILNDVELAVEAINALLPSDSPLVLSSGFVKSLKIGIPWTSILSTPVSVALDTVEVVLCGRRNGAHEQAEVPQPPAALPDWLMSTISRIVGNATLLASNVIVRLQQADIECTFTMQQASLISADPSIGWAAGVVEPQGPQQILSKQLELKDLSVTCNVFEPLPAVVASLPHTSARFVEPSRSRVGSHTSDVSGLGSDGVGALPPPPSVISENFRTPSVRSGGLNSIPLEEPVLSRCSIYARIGVPLSYIFGGGMVPSESEAPYSRWTPSAPSAASHHAGSILGDPFACSMLQSYPSSLSLRCYVHKTSDTPQFSDNTDSGRLHGGQGPAISTRIDTAGARLHVIAGMHDANSHPHKF